MFYPGLTSSELALIRLDVISAIKSQEASILEARFLGRKESVSANVDQAYHVDNNPLTEYKVEGIRALVEIVGKYDRKWQSFTQVETGDIILHMLPTINIRELMNDVQPAERTIRFTAVDIGVTYYPCIESTDEIEKHMLQLTGGHKLATSVHCKLAPLDETDTTP